MSRNISFSFDSEEDKIDFLDYARAKGLTLSALAKMALYQYRAKYPVKSFGKVRMDSVEGEDCTVRTK